MARDRQEPVEEEQPIEDPQPTAEDVASEAFPALTPEEGQVVARYVTYGVGEDEDERWGWEGLDYQGQVIARSEPTFESEKAAEKAIKEQQEA